MLKHLINQTSVKFVERGSGTLKMKINFTLVFHNSYSRTENVLMHRYFLKTTVVHSHTPFRSKFEKIP